MRIAMRTATTRTFIIRFKISHLLSLASTMANSSEAVKECTGDLYSPNFREQLFSETHMQPGESLCVKTGAKGRCAP
jgi:hypothetical protein